MAPYALSAIGVLVFLVVRGTHLAGSGDPASTLAIACVRTLIESLALWAVLLTLFKVASYLRHPLARSSSGTPVPGPTPAVRTAVVYLCADDLDEPALLSLAALEHPSLEVWIHDDSRQEPNRARVDALAARIRAEHGRFVNVMRREDRAGGKPGAMNRVLRELDGRIDVFLLADNDSIAVEPDALARGLHRMADPGVAVVQFRSVPIDTPGEPALNRRLSRSIEVFDLFARFQARHGLPLFLGHNALLRTRAVLDAGGFTPGMFADDIDLTVRMIRQGKRVQYAPDIPFGEKHPSDHGSFRRRAEKWAFGCGQVLRAHGRGLLGDRSLPLATRLGFLEFATFYGLQVLLLAYLFGTFVLLPLTGRAPQGIGALEIVGGALVVLSIFLPVLVHESRRRGPLQALRLAGLCALVYGGTGILCARGLFEGLRGRQREWIPTNAAVGSNGGWLRSVVGSPWTDAAVGAALIVVPAFTFPAGLLQPLLLLVATILVLSPIVAKAYLAEVPARGRVAGTAGLTLTGVVVGIVGFASAMHLAVPIQPPSRQESVSRVTLADGGFRVDGDPFLVMGVHYSPWRDGTGPAKELPWPDEAELREDLGLIQGLGANTIFVHDAPASFLDLAEAHDLKVILTHYVNWQSLREDEAFEARAEAIRHECEAVADHPALLAIVLGNEVQRWIVDQWGHDLVTSRIRSLADTVREVAPGVPLSHANWPITKDLDLSFLDFACFNLYPAWPREVVVQGYPGYIDEVLLPIAGDRPLLISEFGQNTLEAGEARQAELIDACWRDLRSRTAGGVVFAFADEWWKNYDNPTGEGDWWVREHAPDDELVHDEDPEEYYGLFHSDRTPKPAADTVRRMFAEERQRGSGPTAPLWVLVGFLAAVAGGGALLLRSGRRPAPDLH